jgi:hypothetical protein
MSLGRQADRRSDLLLSWDELPRSAGHPFYDRLQEVLQTAGFDGFVEDLRVLWAGCGAAPQCAKLLASAHGQGHEITR